MHLRRFNLVLKTEIRHVKKDANAARNTTYAASIAAIIASFGEIDDAYIQERATVQLQLQPIAASMQGLYERQHTMETHASSIASEIQSVVRTLAQQEASMSTFLTVREKRPSKNDKQKSILRCASKIRKP